MLVRLSQGMSHTAQNEKDDTWPWAAIKRGMSAAAVFIPRTYSFHICRKKEKSFDADTL